MPRAGARLCAQVPPDELDVWQCSINSSIKNSHENAKQNKNTVGTITLSLCAAMVAPLSSTGKGPRIDLLNEADGEQWTNRMFLGRVALPSVLRTHLESHVLYVTKVHVHVQ